MSAPRRSSASVWTSLLLCGWNLSRYLPVFLGTKRTMTNDPVAGAPRALDTRFHKTNQDPVDA